METRSGPLPPPMSLVHDARKIAVHDCNSNANIANLARQWKQAHQGIPKAVPQRIRGQVQTPCHEAAVCLCRNTPRGTIIKFMWHKAEVVLKQFFPDDTDQEKLKQAEAVVLWMGFQDNHMVTELLTAIPIHYVRPWRPTFLQLARTSPPTSIPTSRTGRADKVFTCKVEVNSDGLPFFCTPQQFVSNLDPELKWRMAVGWLSMKEKPFVDSAGRIAVIFPASREAILWWDGHIPVQATRDKPATSTRPRSPPPNTDSWNANLEDKSLSSDEEVAEDYTALDFDPDLLDLWNSIAPEEEAVPELPTPAARSRSSSSSSSSSSHAQPSRPTDIAEKDAKNMGDLKESANKKRKVDEIENDAATQSGNRDRLNHTSFGKHFYITRYLNGEPTGFHMNCRCAGHKKCTKETAFTVTGSLAATRHFLKAWVVLGEGMPSRELHMRNEVRQMLLDALHNGTLMPEADLDAMAAKDDYAEAPFVYATPSSSADNNTVLGDRDSQVDPEVHTQMERLAMEGAIPVSTLKQRMRNRQTVNTSYIVPKELSVALRHGYVSPNMPPPRGMCWKAQGGVWRLCMRGG